jgi:hypothetical protein
MQTLVKFLRTTYVEVTREVKPVVKICVIDDGVDLTASATNLGEIIASGQSFINRLGDFDMINPWYIASGSHGTKIARLIWQNTISARLYIARVDTQDGKLASDQVLKVPFLFLFLVLLYI